MPKKRKSILKSSNNLFDDTTNIGFRHDESADLTGLSKNVSFSAKSKVRHIMPVKTLQQEFDMGDGDSDDDSLSFLNRRSQPKKKQPLERSSIFNTTAQESEEKSNNNTLKKPKKNRKSIFARASEESAETEGETDILGKYQPLPKFDQNAVTKHNKIFDYTNVKPTFKPATTTDDDTDKENTFLNTSNGSGFNSSKVSGSSGTFSFRENNKNAMESDNENTAAFLFKKSTGQDNSSQNSAKPGSQQTVAFMMNKQKYDDLRKTTATPEPGTTPPQKLENNNPNKSMNKSVNKTLGGETARIIKNTPPTSASIEQGDTMALMNEDLASFSQTDNDETTLTSKKQNSISSVKNVTKDRVGIAQQIQDRTNDSINTVDANESRMKTLPAAEEEDNNMMMDDNDEDEENPLENTNIDQENTIEKLKETEISTTKKKSTTAPRVSKLFSDTDDSINLSFTQKPSQGPKVASQTQRKCTVVGDDDDDSPLENKSVTVPEMDFTNQNTKVDDILSFTQAHTSSETLALMNDKNLDPTCLKSKSGDLSMEFTLTKVNNNNNNNQSSIQNSTNNISNLNSILNFTTANTQKTLGSHASKMTEIEEEEADDDDNMDIEETVKTSDTQVTAKSSITAKLPDPPVKTMETNSSSTIIPEKSTVINRPTLHALPVTKTNYVSPVDSDKASNVKLCEIVKLPETKKVNEEISQQQSVSLMENSDLSFNLGHQHCSTKVITSNESSRVLTPDLSITKVVTQKLPNASSIVPPVPPRKEILDTSNVSSAKLELSDVEEGIEENIKELELMNNEKARFKINSSFQKASTSYIKQTNVTFSPITKNSVVLNRPATAMGLQAIGETPLRSPIRVTRRNILKSGGFSGNDDTVRTNTMFDKSIDHKKGGGVGHFQTKTSLESFTVGLAKLTAKKTQNNSESRISIDKIREDTTEEDDDEERMDDATTKKVIETTKFAKTIDIAKDIFQHFTGRLYEAVSSQKQLTPELAQEFDKLNNLERIAIKFIQKIPQEQDTENAKHVCELFIPLLYQSLSNLEREAENLLNLPSSNYILEVQDELLPDNCIEYDSELLDDLLRKKILRMNMKLVRVFQDFNSYLVEQVKSQIVDKYSQMKKTHDTEKAKSALPGPGHKYYGEGVLKEVNRVLQLQLNHTIAKLEYQKKQKEADEWYEKVRVERERRIREVYEERVRSDRIKAYLHRYLVENLKRTEDGDSSLIEFNNGAVVKITPRLFSNKNSPKIDHKMLKSHKITKKQVELLQPGRSLSETGPNDSEFFEKFLQKNEYFAFHQLLDAKREHFLYDQDDKYIFHDETCQIIPKNKPVREALAFVEEVKTEIQSS